jgi:hypothetical protein
MVNFVSFYGPYSKFCLQPLIWEEKEKKIKKKVDFKGRDVHNWGIWGIFFWDNPLWCLIFIL